MVNLGSSCQIYDLARRAKERLKKNNYSAQTQIKLSNAKTFSDYIKSRQNNVKVVAQKSTQNNEDELYIRVCHLLQQGHVQNPVLSLIDREFFDTLSSEAKQFYIANLTQKFKFLVKRYYKEHT